MGRTDHLSIVRHERNICQLDSDLSGMIRTSGSAMTHRCNFCLKGNFQTIRAVSIHIANTPGCRQRMESYREHDSNSQRGHSPAPIDTAFDGGFDGIAEALIDAP
jgi:hypothetical protein